MFVCKQDVDWACGHMGGSGGGNVSVCVFANRMWTGHVVRWVGDGGDIVRACLYICK